MNYVKEFVVSLAIGFGFSITIFSFNHERFGENIIGFIMGIILIGFMVVGAVFFGWRFKQSLKE